MSFIIFTCPSCGRPNISRIKQKTKICVFCGEKNDLQKVKFLCKTNTSREAKKAILKLKYRSR